MKRISKPPLCKGRWIRRIAAKTEGLKLTILRETKDRANLSLQIPSPACAGAPLASSRGALGLCAACLAFPFGKAGKMPFYSSGESRTPTFLHSFIFHFFIQKRIRLAVLQAGFFFTVRCIRRALRRRRHSLCGRKPRLQDSGCSPAPASEDPQSGGRR